MGEVIPADYLVVGAGAAGMAFVDALVNNNADVRVAIVDRRHGAGGHWLQAYPFVRLHQASAFYGVASTMLGTGRIQERGPEQGLHERASAPEVCAYYAQVLEQLVASGRVTFHPNCEYVGDNTFVSRVSGKDFEVAAGCRIVKSDYVAPDIPATTPAPFRVGEGAYVIPVNELVRLPHAPRRFVIVGAGKTATDACIWLLANGVDPDAICWVRPREPWMLNRARLQPDPGVSMGLAADIMVAATGARSPDDLFLRLEAAGAMVRIDESVTPTMAKTPTIAQWEIDRLRTIEDVVRLGHIRSVEPGGISLVDGDITVPRDTVVVHCAAPGLTYPPLVPIWSPDAIRVQPVRAGFPCFGAAVSGYVEATRHDEAEKNRVCPPSPLPDTPVSWARMQVLGTRAAMALAGEADIKQWINRTTLNPARIPRDRVDDPGVVAAMERYQAHVRPGVDRLAQFAGLA